MTTLRRATGVTLAVLTLTASLAGTAVAAGAAQRQAAPVQADRGYQCRQLVVELPTANGFTCTAFGGAPAQGSTTDALIQSDDGTWSYRCARVTADLRDAAGGQDCERILPPSTR